MSFMGAIAFITLMPLACSEIAHAICEWKQTKYQDAIEDAAFIIGWLAAIAIVWNY